MIGGLLFSVRKCTRRRYRWGSSTRPPSSDIGAESLTARVLSRVGVADHEVTPQAPVTGSARLKTLGRRGMGVVPRSAQRSPGGARVYSRGGACYQPPRYRPDAMPTRRVSQQLAQQP